VESGSQMAPGQEEVGGQVPRRSGKAQGAPQWEAGVDLLRPLGPVQGLVEPGHTHCTAAPLPHLHSLLLGSHSPCWLGCSMSPLLSPWRLVGRCGDPSWVQLPGQSGGALGGLSRMRQMGGPASHADGQLPVLTSRMHCRCCTYSPHHTREMCFSLCLLVL